MAHAVCVPLQLARVEEHIHDEIWPQFRQVGTTSYHQLVHGKQGAPFGCVGLLWYVETHTAGIKGSAVQGRGD